MAKDQYLFDLYVVSVRCNASTSHKWKTILLPCELWGRKGVFSLRRAECLIDASFTINLFIVYNSCEKSVKVTLFSRFSLWLLHPVMGIANFWDMALFRFSLSRTMN